RHLESNTEETWEMLGEQSSKAAARAEVTMLPVRSIFNVSRDLGAVRRYFFDPSEAGKDLHDLKAYSDWWNLPSDQRAKQLRDYWRNNLIPRDDQLAQETNRVFST